MTLCGRFGDGGCSCFGWILGSSSSSSARKQSGENLYTTQAKRSSVLELASQADSECRVLEELHFNPDVAWRAQDEEGRTLLHTAASKGFVNLCRSLVEKAAAEEAQDVAKTAARDAERRQGRNDSSSRSDSKTRSDGSKSRSDSKDRIASRRFSRTWSAMFFSPADLSTAEEWVTMRDSYGRTALHLAAGAGQVEVCNFLLMHQFYLSTGTNGVGDCQGWTALHCAASEGHVEACSAILEAHMPGRIPLSAFATWVFPAPDARDDDSCTALHRAAQHGHWMVCKALCGHYRFTPSMAKAKDKKGWTALHYAAAHGHDSVCRVLDKALGAKLKEEVDNEGRKALHLAAERGHASTCKTLLSFWQRERGANQGLEEIKIAVRAARSRNRQLVDANAVDKYGRTALHWAAMSGSAQTCFFIIESPVFFASDAKDIWGRTAAGVAVGEARRDVLSKEFDAIQGSWI